MKTRNTLRHYVPCDGNALISVITNTLKITNYFLGQKQKGLVIRMVNTCDTRSQLHQGVDKEASINADLARRLWLISASSFYLLCKILQPKMMHLFFQMCWCGAMIELFAGYKQLDFENMQIIFLKVVCMAHLQPWMRTLTTAAQLYYYRFQHRIPRQAPLCCSCTMSWFM